MASLLVAGCSGTGSGKLSGHGAAYNGGGVAGGPRQHYPLGRQDSQAVRVTPNRTYQNVSVTAPAPVPHKLPTSLLTEGAQGLPAEKRARASWPEQHATALHYYSQHAELEQGS